MSGLAGDDNLLGDAADDYLDGGEGIDSGDGGTGFNTCVALETELNCQA